MCTAITFLSGHHYFGRTLDLEHTFGESIVIVPRAFPLVLRNGRRITSHYAMIGVATVIEGYPLYYDAANECGLSMAGLNFIGNAHFYAPKQNGNDIAQFELIPYILATCKSVSEAAKALKKLTLVETPFSKKLPAAALHWIIADKSGSITVEPMKTGLKIYRNPVGVLTNNPPFPFQLENLKMYLNLTADEPKNRFSDEISELNMKPFTRGLGAFGMPGDFSSPSRFVRAAFVKCNSVKPENDTEAVGQFFHILSSVEQVEGCVRLGKKCNRTQYSSCIDTDMGIYYCKTYSDSRITAVRLRSTVLDAIGLSSFPLRLSEDIDFIN